MASNEIPFFPLNPLMSRVEPEEKKLLQMLVGQFLVQKTAEYHQSATFLVTFGRLPPDDDMTTLAFGASEGT